MTLASEQLKDPAGTGRILQKLARQRKQLAVYHTRPESAALMARLAIPEGLDWSDPKTVTKYRMADYSCGAGALLIAAYRRVRELHRQSGGSPREVHAAVLEDSITAVDVLPASVALAAAGLDALEPKPAQPGGGEGPHASVRTHQLRNAVPRARGMAGTPRHRAGQPGPPGSRRAPETGPQGHRPGRRRRKAVEVPPGVPGPGDNEPALHQAAGPRNLDRNVPNPELGVQPTSEAELAGM